jgi:hypothetical protein
MTLAMLEANNVDAAAKLFAATTLKGKVRKPVCPAHARLTFLDCLRPAPATPRVAPQLARDHHEKSGNLPCGPQAHSAAALRVPGKPGHPDDRMEGRAFSCCLLSRHRSVDAALRLGLPSCPPRRSHSWTKNRSHSTFGRTTIHHQLTGTFSRYCGLSGVTV